MEISEKMLEEFKAIHKKQYGEDLSDADAHESARNLFGLVELLWELSVKDQKRKIRLKQEPDGFPVDGQYSCLLCGEYINEETGWYSWYGQTCFPCRDAVQSGVVPTFVFDNRNSYFLLWHLKEKFGIHSSAARKYIREGKLIAREVLNKDGSVHEYIFLKKENPELIDRYSPEQKSYDRHRKKVTQQRIGEEKLKQREKLSRER